MTTGGPLEPIPVGAVVRYLRGLQFAPYKITGHDVPPADATRNEYPDGVAYSIWPVGKAQRRGQPKRSIHPISRSLLEPFQDNITTRPAHRGETLHDRLRLPAR